VENYEKIASPFYFKLTDENINNTIHYAKDYKKNLSKYALLSAFSFFENYFKEVVVELVNFH
jgi:hypothetical protein